jgi:acetyl-CoA hydrolase
MKWKSPFAELTADEAAELFEDGMTVGFAGFTPAGAAKAVPRAIAERAKRLHAAGEQFGLRVLSGASSGPAVDDALAEAEAITYRAPFQSSEPLRKLINQQKVEFVDLHLSNLPQMLDFGFLPELDFAVVEATDLARDGRVFLSTSVGASPTFLRHAKRVIVEINRRHLPRVSEMHDIVRVPPPPHRHPIPLEHPMARIGTPFASVDPECIVGFVITDEPDGIGPFAPGNEALVKIGHHISDFIAAELAAGRIPHEFLPLQAGVGNIANTVIGVIGEDERIPPFFMYSEVFQDGLVKLLREDKLLGVSATSLTVSDGCLEDIYDDIDYFASKIVLRPQAMSNNPGIVRRLGVIAINTALEVDIYGSVNSTHVCGTHLMNGIGGSGDFLRNAYLSIVISPSIAKGGRISTVVPMVTHCDHSDHSIQVIVTDQGLADVRGMGPMERARAIIDNCAHPAYREYLHRYLSEAKMGHMPHDLGRCYELHRNLNELGHMLPDIGEL